MTNPSNVPGKAVFADDMAVVALVDRLRCGNGETDRTHQEVTKFSDGRTFYQWLLARSRIGHFGIRKKSLLVISSHFFLLPVITFQTGIFNNDEYSWTSNDLFTNRYLVGIHSMKRSRISHPNRIVFFTILMFEAMLYFYFYNSD